MLKLTWSQVAAWRVRRHHLDQRTPAGSMLTVASRLCGLHAQVLSSALLSLWARVEDLERGPFSMRFGKIARWSKLGRCGAHCTCFPPANCPSGSLFSARVADTGSLDCGEDSGSHSTSSMT